MRFAGTGVKDRPAWLDRSVASPPLRCVRRPVQPSPHCSEGGDYHGDVGIDVHKRTHTFVAVDEAGRQLGEVTVRGHRRRASTWRCAGPGALRRTSWSGRSRTAGTCRPGSSATCWAPASGGAGPAEAHGPAPAPRPAPGASPTRSTPWPCRRAARARPAGRGARPRSRELRLLVDHREDLVRAAHRDDQPAALAPARARSRAATPTPAVAGPAPHLDRLRARLEDSAALWSAGWPATMLADIRALTVRDQRAGARRSPDACVTDRAGAAGAARLRAADRRQDRRRDRRRDPVPLARPRSPCTPASRRSRPRPASTDGRSGWPAAATGNSTPPCTASRSPRSASTVSDRPTTDRRLASRRHHDRSPARASNAASPESCSTTCSRPTDQTARPTRRSGLTWTAHTIECAISTKAGAIWSSEVIVDHCSTGRCAPKTVRLVDEWSI